MRRFGLALVVVVTALGGTALLAAGGGRGGVWDVATGEQALSVPAGSVVAYAPGGRTIAAGDPRDGSTSVWRVESGDER